MVGPCGQLGMGYGKGIGRGRPDESGRHDGDDRRGWRRSASPPPEPRCITAGTVSGLLHCSNAIASDAAVDKYVLKIQLEKQVSLGLSSFQWTKKDLAVERDLNHSD